MPLLNVLKTEPVAIYYRDLQKGFKICLVAYAQIDLHSCHILTDLCV